MSDKHDKHDDLDVRCGSCHFGSFRRTGRVEYSDPVRHEYCCGRCGVTVWILIKEPFPRRVVDGGDSQ